MNDCLLQCLYSALAPAATTNQRRPSLPMTDGNSELSYTLYRSAHTDISPGISIYNGPLLMITARC